MRRIRHFPTNPKLHRPVSPEQVKKLTKTSQIDATSLSCTEAMLALPKSSYRAVILMTIRHRRACWFAQRAM